MTVLCNRVHSQPMGEEALPFRFLSDDEFRTLPIGEKVIYLTLAAQELEERQKVLRTQIRDLNDKLPKN